MLAKSLGHEAKERQGEVRQRLGMAHTVSVNSLNDNTIISIIERLRKLVATSILYAKDTSRPA